MWSQIAYAFQKGDIYIYIIFALGFLGIAFMFERWIILQFVYNIDFKKFVMNLKKMVKAEDLNRALNLCKRTSNTSLPKIALRALEAAETDPTTVKGTIEEEAMDFVPKIEARLGIFPTLATLTLLVGILCTIEALWSTFNSLNVMDTADKQISAGYGIANSLNYTALGLVFCMLFLTGHQFLKSLALRLTEKIHYGVAVLNNLLVPHDVAFVAAGGIPTQAYGVTPPVSESVGQQDPQILNESSHLDDESDGVDSNEKFSSISVEDIKDEEEII